MNWPKFFVYWIFFIGAFLFGSVVFSIIAEMVMHAAQQNPGTVAAIYWSLIIAGLAAALASLWARK